MREPLSGWHMGKYSVTINGQNFLVNLDGETRKLGFLTVRHVEAGSPEEAELAAVQMVRDDQELRAMVLNNRDDPPTMDVDEIVELKTFDGADSSTPGRAWYDPAEDE